MGIFLDNESAVSDEPRKRGRPRVEEPRTTLSVRVWARHHDQLIQIARAQDRSVSSVACEILGKVLTRGTPRQ